MDPLGGKRCEGSCHGGTAWPALKTPLGGTAASALLPLLFVTASCHLAYAYKVFDEIPC